MQNKKTMIRNRTALEIKQKLSIWANDYLDWQGFSFEFKVNPHLGTQNFAHFANEVGNDRVSFAIVVNAYLIDLYIANKVDQDLCMKIYEREMVRAYCYMHGHTFDDNTYLMETVLKLGGLSTLTDNPKAKEVIIGYDQLLVFEAYCSACQEASEFTSKDKQSAKQLTRNLPCPNCGRLLTFDSNQVGKKIPVLDNQYEAPESCTKPPINLFMLAIDILKKHNVAEDGIVQLE